ncbi:MAG: DUF3943 domain-containing protein [Gemmatimonadales bacterium]
MRIRPGVMVLAALTLAAPGDGAGQVGRDGCERGRPMLAAAQTLAVNYAVNRFDALVLRADWARVDFESWSRNLRLGWEWDENAFGTNMFAHPIHGNLYFNAARANCLTFWEAVPFAFLGSWTWEYFGETHRPSLNDFFMTSFGGIALGEMLHQVSTSARDTELTGGARVSRELAAAIFDPVGGLNRLARGEWTRRRPNPAGYEAAEYIVRFAAGARRVREAGAANRYSSTFLIDLGYRDPFEHAYRAPYDVFTLRLQLSPRGGGLNMLRSVGRLYGGDLSAPKARHRHVWSVNQRFDYVDNLAYRYGEQALEAGVLSRWRLGDGDWSLRTEVTAGATLLGAIDGPQAGIGERAYDFGPGVGANAEIALEHRGRRYLALYNRWRALRTVSGAEANHHLLFTGTTAMVPLARGIGLGLYLSDDRRTSRYPDTPREQRSYLEGRLFLTWTDAPRSRGTP